MGMAGKRHAPWPSEHKPDHGVREIPEWWQRAEERRMQRLATEAVAEPRARDMPGYDGSGPSTTLARVLKSRRSRHHEDPREVGRWENMYNAQKQREVMS